MAVGEAIDHVPIATSPHNRTFVPSSPSTSFINTESQHGRCSHFRSSCSSEPEAVQRVRRWLLVRHEDPCKRSPSAGHSGLQSDQSPSVQPTPRFRAAVKVCSRSEQHQRVRRQLSADTCIVNADTRSRCRSVVASDSSPRCRSPLKPIEFTPPPMSNAIAVIASESTKRYPGTFTWL
jgi:hypothetical protein